MSKLKRIVDAMGGVLTEGGRRALIRGPGHGPADRSVSLLETEDGRVLIHCFSPRDDWRAVRAELADLGLLDESEHEHASASEPVVRLQPEQRDEDRRARVLRLWEESASPSPARLASAICVRARSRANCPDLTCCASIRA